MSQAIASLSSDLPTEAPNRYTTGNVLRLAIAQALAGANTTVAFATSAVIGNMLTPTKALATLPISIFVVGIAACTLPAGAVARRYGRRITFLAGTGCGILVGLLSAWAITTANFWLFCVAMFFGGAYTAVVFSFRFAAAECVPEAQRPGALSAVLAGGVFSGVIGPQLVTYTMNLWSPYLFAATAVAQAAVAVVAAFVLAGIRLPRPTAEDQSGGRPLGVILSQPRFIVAVICGTVSYLLMNFFMTSAPLAMRLCGFAQEDANLGLQWHVIAMYAPSFFTGRLVTRFGALPVIAVGLTLIGVAAIVGLTGMDVMHFWVTLAVLGCGWNLSFVGASALVLECHRPEERTRVQSINDCIVFGSVAVGSFTSGELLTGYGWNAVLWVSFLPLIVAVLALAYTTVAQPVRATS